MQFISELLHAPKPVAKESENQQHEKHAQWQKDYRADMMQYNPMYRKAQFKKNRAARLKRMKAEALVGKAKPVSPEDKERTDRIMGNRHAARSPELAKKLVNDGVEESMILMMLEHAPHG